MSEHRFANSGKAITIISRTADGELLAQTHLRLVERAITEQLDEFDQRDFDDLYRRVTTGAYAPCAAADPGRNR